MPGLGAGGRTSGIDGLDAVLGGGLPRRALNLFRGPCGSGKTVAGLQFLAEGARSGENCLLVALSVGRDEVMEIARSLELDLAGVSIEEISPRDLARGMSARRVSETGGTSVLDALLDLVDAVGPDRLVVDALGQLRLLARDSIALMRHLLMLKSMVARCGTCAMLLDDASEGQAADICGVAASVIELDVGEDAQGELARSLVVRKTRARRVADGRHALSISGRGVRVLPRAGSETVFGEWSPSRIS